MKTLTSKFALSLMALLLVVSVCVGPQPAAAQTTMTSTTLSAAVDASQVAIPLASMTGVTAPVNQTSTSGIGNPTGTGIVMLFVDKEAMRVNSINSTASLAYVSRGFSGTAATSHLSGATVYVGPMSYYSNAQPAGSCTSTLLTVLPRIIPTSGRIYTCATTGGQWAWIGDGTMNSAPSQQISGGCTGTVGSAETEFLVTAACSGATTSTLRKVITSPGTIGNLRVYSSAVVVGGSGKDVLTVLKNGSATTITCTIAAAAATCSDTSHYVTVAAGDVLTFSFVTATSDTAANIAAAVQQY